MENGLVQRVETKVSEVLALLRESRMRQEQLRAALVKSREEVERLKAEIQRYRNERTDTRKRVDALLREFESLDLHLDARDR